ncbi:hypothetical protein MMC07_006417 [Pseudocyphellaria aurata]|nr:hypothetical protein [Pseudocyphellaria aurata]
MERRPKSVKDIEQLLQLTELIAVTGRQIIDEWSKESEERKDAVLPDDGFSTSASLPSRELHEMQRTVKAAAGSLIELVEEPGHRLLEVTSQYFEARALHVAAERRIPDLLSSALVRNKDQSAGLSVKEIGNATGVEPLKLSRLLRCLCSMHIFQEVKPDRFDNNTVSAVLVGNEPLRAAILLSGSEIYSASEHLPRCLLDAKKGASYKVNEAPFQEAVGTSKPFWGWLEEKVTVRELRSKQLSRPGFLDPTVPAVDDEESEVSRPELENFGLAMAGAGRVVGAAHVYDYPWASLEDDAVFVDVGSGVGGFSIQLSWRYPRLNFVLQDHGPVLKQAEGEVWPKENPTALKNGRIRFMEHDFFKKNPIEGADVYWLRWILHDWSDEYCIQILTSIRQSMTAKSRILICENVMNTTLGCPELKRAPPPLLANYGSYTRYSHQRDLIMMATVNGIERTPAQFRQLIEAAGMKMQKIWECRSQASLVEVLLRQD